MNKIFSTRIEEEVISQIDILAKAMKTSKKKVVETAVSLLVSRFEEEQGQDVFDATSGAWNREEAPVETVNQIRESFKASFERRQR